MGIYYPQARAVLTAVFDGHGGADSAPTFIDVRPQSLSVHLNSYKESDTWEMTFDARSLPFSPEMIRTAEVQIWLFQTADREEPLARYDGRENVLIAGLVDNMTLRQASDGGTVTMDGRDYTSLMLDRQWDPSRRIAGGQPLDRVIQALVDEATHAGTTGRTLQVVWAAQAPPPVLGAHATKAKKARGITIGDGRNVWDVIYTLAIRHGFIAYVRGFDVIVTEPQTLQAEALEATHRVAYGRNLLELEVERKLGRQAAPQIVVRSYDPRTRQAIEGVFPEVGNADTGRKVKHKKRKGKPTVVGSVTDEFRSFTVPGVTDVGQLTKIAESMYNAMSRGEATVRLVTKHLRDLEGRDLLQLRHASAVRIEWDAFSEDEMRNPQIPTARKAEKLRALGYSPAVADLVAREFDKIQQFRAPYYVREASYEFTQDGGLQVEVEAVNFVAPQRDERIQ